MTIRILVGDCKDHMAAMEPNSVDSIVCDPPYGLEFMGKEWDRLGDVGKTSHAGPSQRSEDGDIFGRLRVNYNGSANKKCAKCGKWAWDYPERKCVCDVPEFPNVKGHQAAIMQAWHESWAREAYRVLKPGGYLLAFGGTRTSHRLVCAIEDAGFEIRDTICWMYGSGFPKSHDISKALDKAAGAEREVVGKKDSPFTPTGRNTNCYGEYETPTNDKGYLSYDITAPATELARQWDGWGSALKPSYEPIVVARKPLIGTLAANVTQYGTGGLNIDGCRIETVDDLSGGTYGGVFSASRNPDGSLCKAIGSGDKGRWPPNVILDETAAAALDAMSGERTTGGQGHNGPARSQSYGGGLANRVPGNYSDSGGASRFMKVVQPDPLPIESGDELRFRYTAKAGRAERNKGLEGMQTSAVHRYGAGIGEGHHPEAPSIEKNHHPTVKPLDLMQWLCRLVTPPGGTVLDPFMGSGSTLIAADREGFHGIGIEMDSEYAEIARRRIMGDCPLFAEVAD